MEKLNGFWVDKFENKWDSSLFDELQATEISWVLNHARNLCKRKNAYSGRTNVSLDEAYFAYNEEQEEHNH